MVNAAADGGGGGGALALKPDQIKIIVSSLQETATDLEARRSELGQVKASAFGGSWMGSFVAGHSDLAYTAVTDALADNATMLQHYENELVRLDKNVQAADEASTDALAVTAARVDELQAAIDCGDAGAGDTTAVCTP